TRLKFSPKVLPKKAPKIIPKPEPQEENKVLTIDKKLITKLGSLQSTYGPGSGTKDEKQGTPVQVAFGQAYPSIPRTFPTPRSFSSGTSAIKLPKEHNEPWDYTCTDCPVTLPLKRPNSGDTEILDEAELGHSSSRAQDGELSAAEELCLTAYADADTNMNMNTKSMGDNRKRQLDSIHGCALKELPGGFMGKLLVFKSGKVKMRLGDLLFDVSAGSNCIFPQEVVAINTREKHCCGIGEIGKLATITPDINSLLGSV
ncbi:hypothetical protein PVAP13_1NG251400, partial [Panicum virgatum]